MQLSPTLRLKLEGSGVIFSCGDGAANSVEMAWRHVPSNQGRAASTLGAGGYQGLWQIYPGGLVKLCGSSHDGIYYVEVRYSSSVDTAYRTIWHVRVIYIA